MQGANLIFLLFNSVCGFTRNKDQMMAFRFLSGIGGSAAQAVSLPKIPISFKILLTTRPRSAVVFSTTVSAKKSEA